MIANHRGGWLACALAMWTLTVGATLSRAQTSTGVSAGSAARLEVVLDRGTVSIRAHGISLRALLQALAERAGFRLLRATEIPDTPIDFEVEGAPIVQVVREITSEAGLGYVMTVAASGVPHTVVVGRNGFRSAAAFGLSSGPPPRPVAASDPTPLPALEPPPDPLPSDPIARERYAREVEGPTTEEMVSAFGRSQVEGAGGDSVGGPGPLPPGISQRPTRVPLDMAPQAAPITVSPHPVVAPPSAGWRPVSPDEVNGKPPR